MKNQNIAFLFPAFVFEFSEAEKQLLAELSSDFHDLCKIAKENTGFTFLNFHSGSKENIDSELFYQYHTYICSCTISDYLKKKGVKSAMAAGYSMGIYAALYHAESISFITGLNLIKQAYHEIKNSCILQHCAMAAIVGLEEKDLQQIISVSTENVEIINKNGQHSFVLSGFADEIEQVVDLCKQEGALHTRLLPVSIAYHSRWMKEAADKFSNYLENTKIMPAKIPLISIINQLNFFSPEDIKQELYQNLCTPIHWMETMQQMVKMKINCFVECGSGDSLQKIGKFIEGNFEIFILKNLQKLIKN